ncbi:DUF6884 domain-containing protein [Streptomyces sp. NPDC052020]|uniref:DUF6884 domain-containing protein n=1 Tax=Streptomyces sp. NPDC052020 TaxID=3155677 RepID=UPI0034232A74
MSDTKTLRVPAQLRKHVLRTVKPTTKGERELFAACEAGAKELERQGRNSMNTIELELTNDALGVVLGLARNWLDDANGNNVMAAKSMLKFELEYEPDDPREIRHAVKMPKSAAGLFRSPYSLEFKKDTSIPQAVKQELAHMSWATNGVSGRITTETLGWFLDQMKRQWDHPTPAVQRAVRKFIGTYTEPYEQTQRLINGYLGTGDDQAPELSADDFKAAVEGPADNEDQEPASVDAPQPWKPDLPDGVSISLISDRPETYGVFCSRHGGAEALISKHEDMGGAIAGAAAHGLDHPKVTPIPDSDLEALRGFGLSKAQMTVLAHAADGRLIEDPKGFYLDDQWTEGRAVKRLRVLDLWARGWLMYSSVDGRRYFRLSPDGKRYYRLWHDAQRQGLIDYTEHDTLNSAKEQRASYPPLVAQDQAPEPEVEPKRLVVIACGGKKSDAPGKIPAEERYTGNYFRACLMASEVMDGPTMVLSAKYGLIPLTEEIENYDVQWGGKGSIRLGTVRDQVEALGLEDVKVTVLGGARYVKAARQIWPDAEAPLEGGIGQQLQQLAGIYGGEALEDNEDQEPAGPESWKSGELRNVLNLPSRYRNHEPIIWWGGKAGKRNPDPVGWQKAKVVYTGDGKYDICHPETYETFMTCSLVSQIHWAYVDDKNPVGMNNQEPEENPASAGGFEVPANFLELAEEANTDAAKRYWKRRCAEYRRTGK